MNNAKPAYSHNPILDGIEHLGHWIHVGEADTVGVALHIVRDGVVVSAEFKQQFPTLAQETGAVAADILQCKALGVAIAAVVAAGGANLAADAAVLAALITDGPAIIKAFADAGQLAATVGADVKQDVASL
jgi:hypothetical protein